MFSFNGLGDFTLSFWARGTGNTPQPFMFSLAVPATVNYMLLNAISDLAFVHIVWRRNASGIHFYKNGVQTDAVIYANQAWAGVIDEMKILSYAITDAELAAGLP